MEDGLWVQAGRSHPGHDADLPPGLEFVSGDRVQLVDLKARPSLNGQCGSIVGWDGDEERWKLAMDDGTKKMFRRPNLRPAPLPAQSSEASWDAGCQPAADGAAFEPGARVRVHGIKAQLHLNGQFGTVVEEDAAEGRWRVRMDDGFGKMFKPQNLELASFTPIGCGSRVRISGIVAQPHLNGQEGTVVDWDQLQATARVTDEVRSGHSVDGPTDSDVAPGKRVRVRDLVMQPQLNGQMGYAVAWDESAGRWKVRMDDGSGKMFKISNLETPLKTSDSETPVAREVFLQSNGEARESSDPREPFEVAPGKRVRVTGIKSQPQLNGQLGTVFEYDDCEERWKVVMDDDSRKMFKARNLIPEGQMQLDIPALSTNTTTLDVLSFNHDEVSPSQAFHEGMRVKVTGIKAQPHLNGQTGTVVAFDEENDRWKVRMSDGSGKMFKAINIDQDGVTTPVMSKSLPAESAESRKRDMAICVGTRVRVSGLQSQVFLNGACGTVIEWAQDEERWKVRMDDGSGKKFRPCYLEASEGTPAAPEVCQDEVPVVAGYSEETLAPGCDPQLGSTGGRVFRELPVPGLEKQPQLNEKFGSAVDWEDFEGRGKVRLDDEAGVMLNPRSVGLFSEDHKGKEEHVRGIDGGWSRQEAWIDQVPKEVSEDGGVPDDVIGAGKRVRVTGLREQSHLNGQMGSATEWDSQIERWKVRMDDGSAKMFRPSHLELSNVSTEPQTISEQQILPGVRVCVTGIVTQPELNGKLGTVQEWEGSEKRWKVKMDDGSGKMLKPKNCNVLANADGAYTEMLAAGAFAHDDRQQEGQSEQTVSSHEVAPLGDTPVSIAPDSRVRIDGLTGNISYLNGQTGRVVDWDDSGRWCVRMDDGSGKRLKPNHLVVCEADPDLCDFSVGGRVRVRDVKAQPSLNGQQGSLVEWVEEEGRWKVRLDDGSGKMLRPLNLETVPVTHLSDVADVSPPPVANGWQPGSRVCVAGLKTQPHLNGQLGTLVEWDDRQERWKVRMDDGSGKMFKVVNMKVPEDVAVTADSEKHHLQPGTRVCVCGLKAQPQLNGQLGTVIEWDDLQERWKVRMDDGTGKMFKSANVEAVLVDSSNTSAASAVLGEGKPKCRASAAADKIGAPHLERHSDLREPLLPGSRVRTCGFTLKRAMNGKFGTVLKRDLADGSWKVRMDDGSSKKFREMHLEALRDELDECEVVEDEEEEMCGRRSVYGSSVSEPSQCSVLPQDFIRVGARVRVRGLAQRPDLNGQMGTAVAWDDGDSRWNVQMEDGSAKMFKPMHLEIAPGSAG